MDGAGPPCRGTSPSHFAALVVHCIQSLEEGRPCLIAALSSACTFLCRNSQVTFVAKVLTVSKNKDRPELKFGINRRARYLLLPADRFIRFVLYKEACVQSDVHELCPVFQPW